MAMALPQKNGTYQVTHLSLYSLSDFTLSYIYPDADGIVWFGATDGLIRYDENLEKL